QTRASGAGGPISLTADRVIVSEGISLTDFVGDMDSTNGLAGTFTARLNGRTPLSGRLAPDNNGTAIRVQSDNAGGILRDAGVFENARSGRLDMTLRPQAAVGVYNGTLKIKDIRVVNAPALTELLSAISIVGLLEQASGPGIAFTDVDAEFQLSPLLVVLQRSSAVGSSLGVSLDGTYDLTTSRMQMEGVLSPVYFLNAIGQAVSRRGEGLFGFSFRLTGSADDPKVRVNPLSILTPGAFRDIFRRRPPPLTQQ
ncbi:MAG: AsmA-like C-terminal region-containing protein, partial [Paracoccaceae bacterium]